MTRFGLRNFSKLTKPSYPPKLHTISRGSADPKSGSSNPIKVTGILVVCFMGFFIFFSALKHGPFSFAVSTTLDLKPSKKDVELDDIIKQNLVMGDYFPKPVDEAPHDKLLGGLLSAGLDEKSCLSRYQSALYRKEQKQQPTSYLVSRLRRYEALHKQCGPLTESYNRSLEYLKSGSHIYTNSTGCQYVIWTPIAGLGNRILSLTSAFLYALLTNRVLLVDPGSKISDLFCEPFPEVSWLLPSNFPVIDKFYYFNLNSPEGYGNLKKNNVHGSSSLSSLPPYLYLHLVHDYSEDDKSFFCEQDQSVVQKVPWLILKSNIYFVPSLYSIPAFQQEIRNLFPDLKTVFHYLGRYLLHPTNFVWGIVTSYYNTNLAGADEKIGIQVRVFDKSRDHDRFKRVLDQILACVVKENNLLPQINETEHVVIPSGKLKTKAVMVTSLSSGYYKALKNMYWRRSSVKGEVIEVFQPSHEEYQQSKERMHNIKAWAEMYLLSLTDKLVTSAGSTFGYVAQSLGGLTPWILYKPENKKVPDPACQRGMTMEPCMHAPPYHDCIRNEGTDTSKIGPKTEHCEDHFWGIKLLDRDEHL